MPLITVQSVLAAGGRPPVPPTPEHVNLDPPRPVGRPATYKQYVERLQAVCVKKGLPLDPVGTVWSGPYHRTSYPLYRVMVRRPSGHQAPVCWASGLHGDEPAGPLGVLGFLEDVYPPESRGALCPVYPLVNPHGFDHQCRGNGTAEDVNRTFGPPAEWSPESAALLGDMKAVRFDLLHTLHEDDSRTGAYCYYSDDARRWLAERLIDQATVWKIPVNSSPADVHGEVKFRRGLAPYNFHLYPAPQTRVPLEDHWLMKGVHHFCTETPRQADLWTRVRCNTDWMRLVWAFA